MAHQQFGTVPTPAGKAFFGEPLAPPGRLEPIRLDIDVRKTTRAYDYFLENGVHNFIAKPSHYFHRISQGAQVLWELATCKYPQRVTAIRQHNGTYNINVHYDNVQTNRRRGGRRPQGAFFSDDHYTFQRHPQVQVMSRNPNLLQDSGQNLVVLDVNTTRRTNFFNYAFNIVNKTHIFTATHGYLFKQVKDGREVLWQAERDEFANMVTVGVDVNGERSIKVYLNDDAESDDEFDDAYVSQVIDVRFPLTSVYPDEFLSPLAEAGAHEPILDFYDQKEVIEGRIPVTLDITKKDSTEQFEFYKRSSTYGIYVPKHNFIFKVVLAGRATVFNSDEILWHGTKPEEYSNKVIIDLSGVGSLAKTHNASVFLVNGDSRHFSRSDKRWVEIDPLTMLDIGSEQSAYSYEVSKVDRTSITTFSPRGKFLFRGVKMTTGVMPPRTVVDIWETRNPKEYSSKVLVKGFGKSERFLVIFQADGGHRLFYRAQNTQMWRDETSNIPTMDTLKLFGVDLNAPKVNEAPPLLDAAVVQTPQPPSPFPEPLQAPNTAANPVLIASYPTDSL